MSAITQINPVVSSLATKRKSHLLFVDALRGMACLWVIIHHTFGSYEIRPGLIHLPFDLLVHTSQVGWLGVSLFLVLSGFCLFYPMAKRQELSTIKLDVKTFFVRRARRILPPYYAALVFSAFCLIVEQHFGHAGRLPFLRVFSGKLDLLLHLTMLFNLTAHSFASINPVFWSLGLEWDLYLIFPLLVFLAAQYGLRAILVPTFAIAVIWQAGAFHRFGFSWDWTPAIASVYHALPGRAFEFTCGMAAAYLVARPRPEQYRAALILLSVLIVPGLWYVLKVARFGPLLDQIWGIIFACVIILLSQVNDASVNRSRFTRALVWFGTISYSAYLVHYPIITLTLPSTFHVPGSETVAILIGLGRIPLIIAVAYLFHLAFERPFMSKSGTKIKTEAQAEIVAVENPAP